LFAPEPQDIVIQARRSISYGDQVTISSMTGFARATGQDEALGWAWEFRSVNGRNLDIRCRLPVGFDRLEPLARAQAGERFKRGSITATLVLSRVEGKASWRIDRDLIERLLALQDDYAGRVSSKPPRLEALLAVRGVVESVEETASDATAERRAEKIGATLGQALDALVEARRTEGARLAHLLAGHLDEIARLTLSAAENAALRPDAAKARLKQQVAALLEAEPALSEERLAQEAALLAAKGDVREEIDRLTAHIAAARELLAEGGAVGRRLDFLCQEFNREANTLCAKASDVALTRVGLELKAAIEQLREQVQNIE
jgi:uncharacterized protein (TIGR00255 family)